MTKNSNSKSKPSRGRVAKAKPKLTRAQQILAAVQAGANTTGKLQRRLKLSGKLVNPVLSKLRKDGFVISDPDVLRLSPAGRKALQSVARSSKTTKSASRTNRTTGPRSATRTTRRAPKTPAAPEAPPVPA